MGALRLFALVTQTVAVGFTWYMKLAMIGIGQKYSPPVLAAIHYQRPGLTIPIILTIGTALLWFQRVREAFAHEDDPL